MLMNQCVLDQTGKLRTVLLTVLLMERGQLGQGGAVGMAKCREFVLVLILLHNMEGRNVLDLAGKLRIVMSSVLSMECGHNGPFGVATVWVYVGYKLTKQKHDTALVPILLQNMEDKNVLDLTQKLKSVQNLTVLLLSVMVHTQYLVKAIGGKVTRVVQSVIRIKLQEIHGTDSIYQLGKMGC